MRFIPLLVSGLLLTWLPSCSDKLARNHLLEGEWTGVSWIIQGQPAGVDPARVRFSFMLPDRYSATLGDQVESGRYYLDQQRLYTTAEGQLEKKVGFELPHPDTLVMIMNRVGREELLTLARQR
jgi:hypothetical protein